MKLIRIFGQWYVHPDERRGEQPNDTGRWRLAFEGVPAGESVRVNGMMQPLRDGAVEIAAPSARIALELRLTSGANEQVETLVFNGDKLIPAAMDVEAFILRLACYMEKLERRVGDDERDIQVICDKKQGAYYLGGARR